MAKITRVEALMVDLVPKVKRTDAIQSFVSQETPIVRITDSDGVVGTGYSYTIGTGGPAIMSLLKHTLIPALIGREASEIERIWRDLLFLTHATSVGAITALALAAIDTALWDLKCHRAKEPLHRLAGDALADDEPHVSKRTLFESDVSAHDQRVLVLEHVEGADVSAEHARDPARCFVEEIDERHRTRR